MNWVYGRKMPCDYICCDLRTSFLAEYVNKYRNLKLPLLFLPYFFV